MNEPTESDLKYGLDEARGVWEEAARVMALHRELASLYRTKSKDRTRIKVLWSRIREGEAGLRAQGVYL